MVTQARKHERIELRATSEEKQLLMEAAQRARLDLTSFIMGAALSAASESMPGAARVELSEREARQLLELLEHPGEPAPALVEAARHRARR